MHKVLMIVLVLLLVVVPVGAQTEATPEPSPEYMTYEQVVELLIVGPRIPGTIYDSPVMTRRVHDEFINQSEVLAEVDDMIADAMAGALQAQAGDFPPPDTSESTLQNLALLVALGVIAVFGASAVYGIRKLPEWLQPIIEDAVLRLADNAVNWTRNDGIEWNDQIAEAIRDEVRKQLGVIVVDDPPEDLPNSK